MDFCIVQNGQMGIKKIIHWTKRSFVIDIFAAMTTENPQAFSWEAFFFGGGGVGVGGLWHLPLRSVKQNAKDIFIEERNNKNKVYFDIEWKS